MTYLDLVTVLQQIETIEQTATRRWKVGDRHAYVLRLNHHWTTDRHPGGADRVRLAVHAYVTDLDGTSKGCITQIDELYPSELHQIAEYKATVDSWIEGRLHDLPPSTVPSERTARD